MKTSFKINITGFETNDNSEHSYSDGSPLSNHESGATVEGATFEAVVEYSPEEMLQIIKNNGELIKQLPSIITACVNAYKTAVATPIVPEPAPEPIAPAAQEDTPLFPAE